MKSRSIFWSSGLAKRPPENLCLFLTQKSAECLTLNNVACNHTLLNCQKFQLLITYGKNYVSDLATNSVCRWRLTLRMSLTKKFLRFVSQDLQVYRVWAFVNQMHILCYDIPDEKTLLVIWFPLNVDPWQITITVLYHFKLHRYHFL